MRGLLVTSVGVGVTTAVQKKLNPVYNHITKLDWKGKWLYRYHRYMDMGCFRGVVVLNRKTSSVSTVGNVNLKQQTAISFANLTVSKVMRPVLLTARVRITTPEDG